MILFFIPLVLFVFVIIYGTYKVTRWIIISSLINATGRNPFRYVDFFPAKLPLVNQAILNRYFVYYKNLPNQLKPIFESRLAKFMAIKDFEGRKTLVMSEEIKTLISACAIQLTFGLREYKLSHFWKIIVYPEQYLSKHTNKFHMGEANPKGALVFSWKDFLKGYSDPDDNYNLGLHEFAHALFINFQRNVESDVNFALFYNDWKEIGIGVFRKLKKDNIDYFRSYAHSNMMEFFAVSIEYFFETPNEFKKYYPELYNVLQRILSQDPSMFSNPPKAQSVNH